MKKTTLIAIVIVIVLGLLLLKAQSTKVKDLGATAQSPSLLDYKNTTYVVGGQNISLKNGESSVEVVPGSGIKILTKVFGNEIRGDFNGDGKEDVAFFMTQTGNGSGTFYYAAVALKNETGYKGTNAIFLGDRVAPQNIGYSSGVLAVNYVDRKSGDPMTTTPSIGKTKFLTLDIKRLVELTLGKNERLVGGTLTWGGNDIREFKPCGEQALWIDNTSLAYTPIKDLYSQVQSAIKAPTTKPYTPIFSVLIGRTVRAPKAGPGSTYKNSFEASQVINMNPAWKCN